MYSSFDGIRGIAAILVTLFHLYPSLFSNGFIGFDIIFVISGFCISNLLNERFTLKGVVKVYEKQFNRLLPYYFITLLLSVIGVLSFVLKQERSDFISDIKWSILLMLNFKSILTRKAYWDQESSVHYLSHFWSICVEIQYYLMAPFIQFFLSGLPLNFRVVAYIISIIASCFSFYQIPFEISYSLPIGRLWQFLLGSLAFEISKNIGQNRKTEKKDLVEKIDLEEKKEKVFSKTEDLFVKIFFIIFVALTSFAMIFPTVFKQSVIRVIMSLVVFFICANHEKMDKSYFRMKPLMYIGNISTLLYLMNWPVISFVRYIQMKDTETLSILEASIAVIITVIITVIFKYCFEHFYEHYEGKVFVVSFGIVMLCASVSYTLIPWLETQECWAQSVLSEESQNKILWNFDPANLYEDPTMFPCFKLWKNHERYEDYDEKDVNYCREMSEGRGKVLVIGNSMAVKAFPVIRKLFNGSYEELRLFSRLDSSPLLNIVPKFTNECQEMVKEFQPDLLWIIQGVNEITNPFPTVSLPSDPSVWRGIMQNVLDEMKNYAKIIYIDLPYFVSGKNTVNNIAKSLIYGHDIERIASHSKEEVEKQIGLQSLRLRSLNCHNCHYQNVNMALMRNDSKFFDYQQNSSRPIIYDGIHISTTGYGLLTGLYQRSINRFISYINKTE